MSEPFIGQIQLFGFNFPPRGWAFCNGATLAIQQNTALFSQSTGYMPVRTSAVESDTMTAIYEQTPQFRTAVDQLADKARIQDDVRVFVPGADALLNDAIEQIVIEGTDPATAFESITPQIERAYEENVEPYL